MYKDRTSTPHQLSYSSVTNYQASLYTPSLHATQFITQTNHNNNNKNNNNDRLQLKQSIKQLHNTNNRKSSKFDSNNNDLAFLRNTMGPKYHTYHNYDNQYLKANQRQFDNTLRQTTGNFVEIREKLRLNSPNNIRVEFIDEINRKNQKLPSTEGHTNRLEKIMDKYQKKNQTKEALKLLQQLKELKKKQQQLKKQQRKNQQKNQEEQKNINLECNSPINFSKKNKVEYYTPNIQKNNQICKTNSPKNQACLTTQLTSKDIYDEGLGGSRVNSIKLSRSRSKSPLNFTPTASFQNKQAYGNGKSYSNYLTSKKYAQKSSYQFSIIDETSKPVKYIRDDKQPTSPLMSKKNHTYESYNNILSNANKKTARDLSKSPNSKLYQTNYISLNNPKYSNGQIKSIKSNHMLTTANTTSRNSISSVGSIKDTFLNRKVSINDFLLGKNLGEGKFGTVYQAFDKKSKSLYALKKVPKSIIKSHWMVDQFILQVKLQAFLNHPNILTLFSTFDDTENVYILLEYMQEGTLFLQLKKNQTFDQKQAAKRLKEIASAVQYLHQNNIAHRDIKPQNIVISHGVCKLCDFGWATICDQRRKTYCGTFDYAAPQILEGSEYDMSVDLWCLGILAYQMLVGKAPFYHISRKQTMKKIMNVQNQKINYPSSMSREAKSFIEELLRKNPQQRLKSEDLLNHPFLRNEQK